LVHTRRDKQSFLDANPASSNTRGGIVVEDFGYFILGVMSLIGVIVSVFVIIAGIIALTDSDGVCKRAGYAKIEAEAK
jgi:hypothetical protein